jgi:citrate synthase
MPEEIHFVITQENLETGMRGYPVGYCTTSSADSLKGLHYMGQPVDAMTKDSAEEVIYLLFYGKKPDKTALEIFKKELANRSHVSSALLEQLEGLPKHGHPMKLFCLAILLLGIDEATGIWQEDCLNIIAKIPLVAAHIINRHGHCKKTPKANPELGLIENFTHLLQVDGVDKEKLQEILRLFYILHLDHGGGNLSAFVGKCVASGEEDMYGSMASAMCALNGPRHGKANQYGLEFVKKAFDVLGKNATHQEAAHYIENCLHNNELIYGFGHAVLRVEDPRATIFYAMAGQEFPDHPLVKTAILLRTVIPEVLKKNPKIQNPYPNIDAISGSLLSAAGLPFPEYYTVLFGISRCVGISIQILYERTKAREGKGTPIMRPKYIFRPQDPQ